MTAHRLDEMEHVAPTDADAKLAADSARLLAPHLAKANGATRLQLVDDEGGIQPVTIPASALRLLVTILGQMADGNAVRLMPQHAELTTWEAAELLNVSRPHLVRLLDEGRIPHHKVGTHRRVLLDDLLAYRTEHRRARTAALDEMTSLSQELGLY